MKKILLFFCSALLFTTALNAQAPAIEWQKCLGGSGFDVARAIRSTSDGGYILAGEVTSVNGNVTGNHGSVDYWVVKINNTGGIQWQKTYGGSQRDYAQSIELTSEGGYIVTGYSESVNNDVTGNHGDFDWWVAKLDSAGTIQWQKSLGGTDADKGFCVQQAGDGGYLLSGEVKSGDGDITGFIGYYDFRVLKLDNAGEMEWQKCLGGTGPDRTAYIRETRDHGYIIAGTTQSDDGDIPEYHLGSCSPIGCMDILIYKLDSALEIEWQRSLGGTKDETAWFIEQTADNGYIAGGKATSTDGDVTGNHGDADYWIVKLDSAGVTQWKKSLGGALEDLAMSIEQTSDGGYAVSGYTFSTNGNVSGNHGGCDAWIVKLSSTGTTMWQKTYGGTAYDYATSILQTPDGGYTFAGSSASVNGDVSGNHGDNDYWVVKLEGCIPVITLNGTELVSSVDNGNQWYYEGLLIDGAIDQSYTPVENGYYYVYVHTNNGCIAYSDSIHMLSVGVAALAESAPLIVYPNPVANNVTIETTLYSSTSILTEIKNATGQVVYSFNEKANSGLYKRNIYLNLAGGIYYMSLQTNEKTTIRKIEVVH